MSERESNPPILRGEGLDQLRSAFGIVRRDEHARRVPRDAGRREELGERVSGVMKAIEGVRTQLERGRRVALQSIERVAREQLTGPERPDDGSRRCRGGRPATGT